jgi:hypothetical protein
VASHMEAMTERSHGEHRKEEISMSREAAIAFVRSAGDLTEQARLDYRQGAEPPPEPDGRWSSQDGPQRDVHTTMEALRVLALCHRL